MYMRRTDILCDWAVDECSHMSSRKKLSVLVCSCLPVSCWSFYWWYSQNGALCLAWKTKCSLNEKPLSVECRMWPKGLWFSSKCQTIVCYRLWNCCTTGTNGQCSREDEFMEFLRWVKRFSCMKKKSGCFLAMLLLIWRLKTIQNDLHPLIISKNDTLCWDFNFIWGILFSGWKSIQLQWLFLFSLIHTGKKNLYPKDQWWTQLTKRKAAMNLKK